MTPRRARAQVAWVVSGILLTSPALGVRLESLAKNADVTASLLEEARSRTAGVSTRMLHMFAELSDALHHIRAQPAGTSLRALSFLGFGSHPPHEEEGHTEEEKTEKQEEDEGHEKSEKEEHADEAKKAEEHEGEAKETEEHGGEAKKTEEHEGVSKIGPVVHVKEKGGGYLPGSPLYTKQAGLSESHGHEEEHGHPHGEGEGHGEHHGAGHGHGHGHEPRTRTGLALALMLMGTVGFVMTLFYLVNYRDPDIRQETWKLLNTSISIFIAVLLFVETKGVVNDMLGREGGHHHGPTSWDTVAFTCMSCLVTTVFLECLLYAFRNRIHHLIAWGILAAHIAGFSAIDFYGSVQGLSFFGYNAATSLLAVLIATVCLSLLFVLGAKLREKVSLAGDGIISEDELRWDEECVDVEDDLAGLCIGLLLSRSIQQAIIGELPSLHGDSSSKTALECGQLFLSCVALSALVIVFCTTATPRLRRYGKKGERVGHITECVLAMTNGWCMLFLTQWVFFTVVDSKSYGDKMTALQVIALGNSALVVPAIFAVDFAADRAWLSPKAIRSFGNSFGLCVGLSWEQTFGRAVMRVEELLVNYVEHPILGDVVKIGLVIALCALVLPAWRLYILPKAVKEPDGKGDAQHP